MSSPEQRRKKEEAQAEAMHHHKYGAVDAFKAVGKAVHEGINYAAEKYIKGIDKVGNYFEPKHKD